MDIKDWQALCAVVEHKVVKQTAPSAWKEYVETQLWLHLDPHIFNTTVINACVEDIERFIRSSDHAGLERYKLSPPQPRALTAPQIPPASGFPNPKPEISDQPTGYDQAVEMAHRIVETLGMFSIPMDLKEVVSAPRLWLVRLTPNDPPAEEILAGKAKPVNLNSIKTHRENLIVRAGLPTKPEPMILPEQGFIEIQIAKEKWEPCLMLQSDYLKQIQTNTFYDSDLLKVPVGLDTKGRVVDIEIVHLLGAGESGSGKSSNANAIIGALMLRYPPRQLQWVFIDVAKVGLSRFNDTPWFWPGTTKGNLDHPNGIRLKPQAISNPGKALKALDALTIEYEQRLNTLNKAGVDSISKYNRKYPDTALPRIALYIDEYAEFRNSVGNYSFPEIEDPTVRQKKGQELLDSKIVQAAQAYRKVGIHLLVYTQRPSADNIVPDIRDNLTTRIALKCASEGSSTMLFGTKCDWAVNLLGRGDFWLIHNGVRTRCQSFYIDDEEVTDGKTQLDRMVEGGRMKYKVWWTENRPKDEIPEDVWDSEAEFTVEEKALYAKLISIPGTRREKIRVYYGYNSGSRYQEALETLRLLEEKFGSLE